ncbi:MAG: biotin/lipoyl-containing protein [Anaerolineae bacterium]|nr:biotin/lipoyl-containing protein [Anaerolineae bacterium]
MRYRVEVEGRYFEIEVRPDGTIWVDGRPVQVDAEGLDGPFLSLLVGPCSYEAGVGLEGPEGQVVVEGRTYRTYLANGWSQCATRGPHGPTPPADQPAEVVAPLPGLLVEVRVAEGESVQAGTVVAVMESMKMHLELRSPRDGVIRSLPVRPGREVAQGEVLAIID